MHDFPFFSAFRFRQTCLHLLLLALFFAVSPLAQAQVPARTRDVNQHAWYMYFGDNRLTDKLGFHSEVQFRRAGLIREPQQLLLRGGLNYHPLEHVMLTAGYLFAQTYPYGDFPAAAAFPEHRIYEQLQMRQAAGRFALVHRYRLEQRWVTRPSQTEATYLNRARYFFRATLPLQGPSLDDREFYLAAYDEIFIGFGKNVAANTFDQNRLYGALGFRLSPQASVELGYLNQIAQQGNGRVYEHNHTLQAALFYNLDLRRE